jgi:hypothetical protein
MGKKRKEAEVVVNSKPLLKNKPEAHSRVIRVPDFNGTLYNSQKSAYLISVTRGHRMNSQTRKNTQKCTIL